MIISKDTDQRCNSSTGNRLPGKSTKSLWINASIMSPRCGMLMTRKNIQEAKNYKFWIVVS